MRTADLRPITQLHEEQQKILHQLKLQMPKCLERIQIQKCSAGSAKLRTVSRQWTRFSNFRRGAGSKGNPKTCSKTKILVFTLHDWPNLKDGSVRGLRGRMWSDAADAAGCLHSWVD